MSDCLDCKKEKRNKKAKRCSVCFVAYRKRNSKGRTIGVFCKDCGKELSFKNTTTNTCIDCYRKSPLPPWNKGTTGICEAWNKGKSIFKDEEERSEHINRLRRIRYHKQTNKEKIPDRIRTLIRNSFKHKTLKRKKDTKTVFLLGCSIEEFIKHIESYFKKGMTWSNYGNRENEWNLDHIIPVSSFDLDKKSEQLKAFNYKNYQPMWAKENFKKGNRLPTITKKDSC